MEENQIDEVQARRRRAASPTRPTRRRAWPEVAGARMRPRRPRGHGREKERVVRGGSVGAGRPVRPTEPVGLT